MESHQTPGTKPSSTREQTPVDAGARGHNTSRTIKIDGMTGDACVQKVKRAIAGVPGVATESVRVGQAFIKCDTTAQCDAACKAIDGTGFKAKSDAGNKARDEAGDCSSKSSTNMVSEGAGGAIAGARGASNKT